MLMRSSTSCNPSPATNNNPRQKQTTMLLRIDDLEIEEIQSPGHHLRLRIKDPHLLRNMALRSSSEAAASLSG